MSISIFIVTHNKIGEQLLTTVSSMIDTSQLDIHTISIPSDISAEQISDYQLHIKKTLLKQQQTNKLILCDIYGATPYNLVKDYAQQNNSALLTGINLAMLLKAVQLTEHSLDEISQQAQHSAQQSIILEQEQP